MKFRVVRDEEVIADNLTLSTLKHHKKSVSQIDKGMECGICFNSNQYGDNFDQGDIIECYEEVETDNYKFQFKAGVVRTF